MKTIVTFGEMMLRLSPPGFQRLRQARSFEAMYVGSEANVAVSLANFGLPVEYLTRLPQNDLGDACLASLRAHGVGLRHVARGGERLGVYFVELGAAQRGLGVIYDRGNSGMATLAPGMLDWTAAFAGAGWFHWTGITPALSAGAAAACREALSFARQNALTISCDLNYRKLLWKWGRPASEVMPELIAQCDLLAGNEESLRQALGLELPPTDPLEKEVAAERYQPVFAALARRFPNLRAIALTLRGYLSASHNTWAGLLWEAGESGAQERLYVSPRYDIAHIVDRVGAGDAFLSGLIYGWSEYPDRQAALDFAVAAACLKHSIPGDFNLVSVGEVESLMRGGLRG